MKKVFIYGGTAVLMLAGSLFAKAQTKSGSTAGNALSFGAYLEPIRPLGTISDATGFGIGVNVMGNYQVMDQLSLRASIGYMTFFSKTVSFTGYNDNTGTVETYSVKPKALHAIPFRVGADYMLTDNLYVQANTGLAFISDGGGTALIYSPGVGYKIDHFDLLLKYEGWAKTGTISFLGLHLGYLF